jgi:hypothetical protein
MGKSRPNAGAIPPSPCNCAPISGIRPIGGCSETSNSESGESIVFIGTGLENSTGGIQGERTQRLIERNPRTAGGHTPHRLEWRSFVPISEFKL